jgi:transcription elongation factor Elf1
MKIKQVIDRRRHKVRAIYECEGCGHEEMKSEYIHADFLEIIIPKMICPACGKTGAECGADHRESMMEEINERTRQTPKQIE